MMMTHPKLTELKGTPHSRKNEKETTVKSQTLTWMMKLIPLGNERSKQKADSPDCTLLDEIEQEYESDDDVGPNISEKLAHIVTTMKKAKLSDDRFKEKLAKHKRPANCEISVPKVNPEIWALM